MQDTKHPARVRGDGKTPAVRVHSRTADGARDSDQSYRHEGEQLTPRPRHPVTIARTERCTAPRALHGESRLSPQHGREGEGPDHDMGVFAGLWLEVLHCVPWRSPVRSGLPEVYRIILLFFWTLI